MNPSTPAKAKKEPVHITKRFVDAVKPEAERRYYWDSKDGGFGLLVLPSGVKSYVYQYRTPEGRTRRITIGKASDALTADQARAKARMHHREVFSGIDPLAVKDEKRNASTVGQMLDAYLASPTFAEKRDTTRGVDLGRINRHLRPLLGRKLLKEVTGDTVRRAFADIAAGKTAGDFKTGPRGRARVKGGEGTARMSVRLLRAVFTWAIKEGMATANPAAIDVGQDGERMAIMSEADYGRLFEALDKLETGHSIRPAVADAVRLIALTGARRGEVASLRWRYVDMEQGLIRIPASEHKTGKKTRADRLIALPAEGRELLERQPKGEPDAFVFAPSKGEGALSLSKAWRAIRTAAGLPEDMGLHGLRHALASSLAANSGTQAELMAVLGHRQATTTAKYIHWADRQRQLLAEKAASAVVAGLGKARAAR